ncbi:DUF2793 domain-containing protein [Jannaschia rubra]|uniref:C1q domain protein n=2 Tax=Jannaschia rubra TaxID=282197 RepID=A0A0M6XQB5_9RHOB|nr:DUF2793 domain-containing protein [Jannaschia rubra]CTQ33319.1 C1q domain protein [Jannaschia rubra]SFF99119.1 C1q domain-containing protein [Jannaschia rubra]
MSQRTTLLSMPLIQAGQAQKHVTHNEALVILDALVQPVALDADRTEPPATPDEGDRHLVAAGAAGAWAGHDGDIAVLANGGWLFLAPQAGWKVHVRALSAELVFDGTLWAPAAAAPVATLGVNATADTTNRLSVAADGTLLTHEGGDHRLTVNKATAGDTASLLFQTGWSGRAEMGTAGTDGFSVKVSADGTDWHEGVTVDAASGVPGFPSLPYFSAIKPGAWAEITTPNTDLPFDTATANVGGHFNTATGAFAAPVAGLYAFLINGFLADTTDARICYAINGLSQVTQMQVLKGPMPLSFLAVFALAPGDRVTCRTGNLTKSLRYFQSHTALSGWKIA